MIKTIYKLYCCSLEMILLNIYGNLKKITIEHVYGLSNVEPKNGS